MENTSELQTNTVIVKLTKKAVSDVISWTNTRYNDYLGYGNKREAVLSAYHSILNGYVVNVYVYTKGKRKGDVEFRHFPEKTTLELECASACGERQTNGSGSSRYWRTKSVGGKYIVDCLAKSITALKNNEIIRFN